MKNKYLYIILLILVALNVYFFTKIKESEISAEEGIFFLNSESMNTLTFASRALYYFNLGDIYKAKEKLDELVEINLKVMSIRLSNPDLIWNSEALKQDEIERLLFLYIGLHRTNDNIEKSNNESIKQALSKLIDTVKVRNPEAFVEWESMNSQANE